MNPRRRLPSRAMNKSPPGRCRMARDASKSRRKVIQGSVLDMSRVHHSWSDSRAVWMVIGCDIALEPEALVFAGAVGKLRWSEQSLNHFLP